MMWFCNFRSRLLETGAFRVFPRHKMHWCTCWRLHPRSWTYCGWNQVHLFSPCWYIWLLCQLHILN